MNSPVQSVRSSPYSPCSSVRVFLVSLRLCVFSGVDFEDCISLASKVFAASRDLGGSISKVMDLRLYIVLSCAYRFHREHGTHEQHSRCLNALPC